MASKAQIDAMNAMMVKFIPELASEYARYPMQHDRWYDGKETGPKGERCWLKGPNTCMKMDYIFGRGRYGEGYYSLLTKASYIHLYARMTNEPPGGCCACSAAARKELDEFDDVKRLIHARSVASVPDDQVARSDAIKQAQGVASMWYNGMENEALAINIVNSVNPGG